MRRTGWKPERRNRKLGTPDWAWRDKPDAQEGFAVPWPTWEHRTPEERWTPDEIEQHQVHGRTVMVVAEKPRAGSAHVCTPADVCGIMGCLPAADVAGIGLVVLRQPTRKEDILRPAWGRMHWCVEFRGYNGPAVVLDAVDFSRPRLRWPRSLSPDQAQELQRMRQLGFTVAETRRGYDILLTPEQVRRWLLTRTLPHEVGHWVDLRRRVLDPLEASSAAEAYRMPGYDELAARWSARPQREREQSADGYADRMQSAVGDGV